MTNVFIKYTIKICLFNRDFKFLNTKYLKIKMNILTELRDLAGSSRDFCTVTMHAPQPPSLQDTCN